MAVDRKSSHESLPADIATDPVVLRCPFLEGPMLLSHSLHAHAYALVAGYAHVHVDTLVIVQYP